MEEAPFADGDADSEARASSERRASFCVASCALLSEALEEAFAKGVAAAVLDSVEATVLQVWLCLWKTATRLHALGEDPERRLASLQRLALLLKRELRSQQFLFEYKTRASSQASRRDPHSEELVVLCGEGRVWIDALVEGALAKVLLFSPRCSSRGGRVVMFPDAFHPSEIVSATFLCRPPRSAPECLRRGGKKDCI